MALTEFYTPELCIYTVEPRKNKGDEYTMRKIQKDRMKIYTWMKNLLDQNEMIIFYKEDNEEKHIICTGQIDDHQLLDAPVSIVEYRGDTFVQCHWLRVIEYPGRLPKNIHIDSITKFILKNDNVGEIANELYYRKK